MTVTPSRRSSIRTHWRFTVPCPRFYNFRVQIEDLKILLAVEPLWTVSINGQEFLHLRAGDIALEGLVIRFGRYIRTIVELRWMRPNTVRMLARPRFRSQTDMLTFYPGHTLPAAVDLRKRRRTFQQQIAAALGDYFHSRPTRHLLSSDRQHGIGGAYPRIFLGAKPVIAVDPDEPSAVVHGIMRAAILWSAVLGQRVWAVVPANRKRTLATRLRSMPALRSSLGWLEWDGRAIAPLDIEAGSAEEDAGTRVHEYRPPEVAAEVARICALAPGLLQPTPCIPEEAVSIRLRGIEIARISGSGTVYPLGEPLPPVIERLLEQRRHGSRHPLARAHEERWLESSLLGRIGEIAAANPRWIYPQVPSFVGEDRNIIDLLGITGTGRLMVVEIKVKADPDLPFQAFDYWLAVERHRKSGEFQAKGYFRGIDIMDRPAILVLVAPLLGFHKTIERLATVLPRTLSMVEIGINQGWKKEIKVLRRRNLVG